MNCKQIILVLLLTTSVVVGYSMSADSTKVSGKRDSTFVIHSKTPVPLSEESDILNDQLDIVDSLEYYFKYVEALKATIDKTQNFINTIDAATSFKLPVAISKKIAGQSYDIIIDAVRIKPTHAELDVIMQFDPPDGKALIFMAKGIKISNKGGVIGDAKLMLISDVAINFGGDKTQLFIRGGSGHTYVTMDCDGFKEMSLDADVLFSRDLLVPENLDGTIQPEGRVKGSFKTTLSNWNDLIVQLTLPDFQVRGLQNFGFSIRDAVFDFSDIRNAPSVKFPDGYSSASLLPDNSNLWRGIFVREVSVRLPRELKTTDATRKTITANDLIIDNLGISGRFTGRNLIPLNEGNMNGWAFSLDSISVSLMANQVQEAGFKGDIVIPISDQQTPFHYTAWIGENNNYLFTAKAGKDFTIPVWQATKANIYEGSRLEVKVVNGAFLPKAVLSGDMTIQGKLSEKGQGVSLADIQFQDLTLQSERPYIQVGFFSFGSEAAKQTLAGFPVQIEDVKMKNISDTQTGLAFSLKVNLVAIFSADADMMIVGQMSPGQSQSWKFKQVDISSLVVDIDNGEAFKLKGSIKFYRADPTYGDGFNGSIDATFLSKITIKGSAIFGNVNGNRYWYVDALAEIKPGIPIFPGVAISGFGGGVYYAMRLAKQDQGSSLGRTQSGSVYIPDVRTGIGLKATIEIATTPSASAFNADVTLEIAFYATGGIRYISFLGNAFIATDPVSGTLAKIEAATSKMVGALAKLDGAVAGAIPLLNTNKDDESLIASIHGPVGKDAGQKGSISARIFIEMDFEASTLHSNFKVGINVANGIITGGGEAVLHFGPGEWYVYIGVPDNRFYLAIGIGPIRAQADAYFMVGTKILNSPPPPEAVSRILGGGNYDYMKDLNAIGQGAGFAFGTSFSISTGELQFLIFYSRFEAGAGFDIMLKNYGDTRCEGSGDLIGVNGWYANGQAYAYFDGEIGIKVDLFFVSGKFPILSIGAAALLQTKLPNPTWFRGIVGGHFSILGGLVEGSCRFEITLGSECKIVKKEENILNQIKVISQLTPGTGETDVNVFNSPQAVFNMPVDQVFEMNDVNSKRSFRIKMGSFKFTADGQEIAGTQTWNERHDVVAFNPIDVLPPRKEIKAVVQVSFEEQKGGSWSIVKFDGKEVTESLEASFKTGDAPDNIPLSNVEYSYPVIGQVNFYRDESPEGYIKLKQGQGYLFTPGAEWKQVGRLTTLAGKKVEFNFTYTGGMVGFNIPQGLSASELYMFELVNVPAQKSGAVDRNVNQTKEQVIVGNQSTDTEIKTQKADGNLTNLEEKSIFTSYFRTSKYETFAKKVAAQNIAEAVRGISILWKVHYLAGAINSDEPFDKAEIFGNPYTKSKPLVTLKADLSDNKYYNEKILPLVYDGYPLQGSVMVSTRNPDLLGIPPTGAVDVVQFSENSEVDQSNPYAPIVNGTTQYYYYDLPRYFSNDFHDMQTQIARYYIMYKDKSPRIEQILWGDLPSIIKGQYKVNVQYQMPGRDGVKSTHQIILNNPAE